MRRCTSAPGRAKITAFGLNFDSVLSWRSRHPFPARLFMKITEQPYYARLAFILICIVFSYLILSVGSSVLIPIAFAFLVSLVLHPLVQLLRRRLRLPDTLAIAFAVAGFLGLLVGLIYLLSFQMADFAQDFPALRDKVMVWAKQGQVWAERSYNLTIKDQESYLERISGTLMSGAAATVGALILTLGHFLFWTAIVFIYSFFILSYRQLIARFVTSLFPAEHRLSVNQSLLETRKVINGYVLGLLTETAIVTVASTAGLMILGIRYALLLGLLTGVLNIIPYIGFLTALTLTGLLTLVHHSPLMALAACSILVGIHLLDANLLAPRVIGGRVRMNPLATLIGVFVGGLVWGIPGLFLAIPLTAVTKVVFSHVEALQPWAMVMGTEDDAPLPGELVNEPEPLEMPEIPPAGLTEKPLPE